MEELGKAPPVDKAKLFEKWREDPVVQAALEAIICTADNCRTTRVIEEPFEASLLEMIWEVDGRRITISKDAEGAICVDIVPPLRLSKSGKTILPDDGSTSSSSPAFAPPGIYPLEPERKQAQGKRERARMEEIEINILEALSKCGISVTTKSLAAALGVLNRPQCEYHDFSESMDRLSLNKEIIQDENFQWLITPAGLFRLRKHEQRFAGAAEDKRADSKAIPNSSEEEAAVGLLMMRTEDEILESLAEAKREGRKIYIGNLIVLLTGNTSRHGPSESASEIFHECLDDLVSCGYIFSIENKQWEWEITDRGLSVAGSRWRRFESEEHHP